MKIVSLARGQHRHFLVHPLAAPFFLKLFLQIEVDVAQIGHVRQRIIELLVGKRAAAPVGKPRGLVEVLARNLLHELVIGNRIAKAADHCRHLRVENWRGDQIAQMKDNLDILPGGMEDLDDFLIGHQAEEGRKVQPRRQRIHQRRMVR